MILSCIELIPAQDKRQELLEILRFVECGVRRNPACNWCGVYESADPEATILYLEQWTSEREFRCHIQSRAYLPILNAIDLANEQPRISFYDIESIRSMEFIEALRARDAG